MSLWESAIADCNECLKVQPDSMKAHFYLAQAHLEMNNIDVALDHALKAYDICAATNDKSLTAIVGQVLKCKQEKWAHLEKLRRRERADLEAEVLAMMERDRDQALQSSRDLDATEGVSEQDIREEWDKKMEAMRDVFETSRAADQKKRQVPEWAIDDITFGFMHDPVITKTGKSYERASIVEHLRRSKTDPLTREPLDIKDLRPNRDLKQACDEFLEQNGWAVDW